MSTRGQAAPVSLREALFSGLAPDGGLYVPERLEPLPVSERDRLWHLSLPELASVVASHLFRGDLPEEALYDIVEGSLNFEIPLVRVTEGIWSLELFHGPTLAFKDVGARFMARLMAHFLSDIDRELTILVATSGDTGSAIAHAYFRMSGIRVVVLFPRGQVSSRQQKQFTTLGENIRALSIGGTFDDCQALAKQAFADPLLQERLFLASANSINVGRLLPQMFYYFHAVAQLPPGTRPVLISVPSGNFGNLTAGLLAKRLGLPCDRFVAATNINDVVPEYLETGHFRPRPSQRTLSNAMDVGNPSNFNRILDLYGHDLDAIRRDLAGSAHSDQETRAAIRDVHRRFDYVLDPHAAVGYLGLQTGLKQAGVGTNGMFLATAHPAKFATIVEPEIEQPVPLPQRLANCLHRPEQVVELPADHTQLRDYLLADA